MIWCQLDHYEPNSVKFSSQYINFRSQKCILIYRQRNGGNFVWVEMSLFSSTGLFVSLLVPLDERGQANSYAGEVGFLQDGPME